jgi:peptide/nickel transport system permease protein
MSVSAIDLTASTPPRIAARARDYARRHPTVIVGAAVLFVMGLIAIFAPWIANDPMKLTPINRLKPPSEAYWFGTDFLGREVFARTIYGARVSLLVGGAVALVSVAIGLVIGLVAGYVRWIDAIVMRVMDGIMAIPGVLLAIALIAVAGASLTNVIIAITIPEIPRVVRLVRSVVLSIREQPYVEAAVSVGSPLPKILFKHILPNTIALRLLSSKPFCRSSAPARRPRFRAGETSWPKGAPTFRSHPGFFSSPGCYSP